LTQVDNESNSQREGNLFKDSIRDEQLFKSSFRQQNREQSSASSPSYSRDDYRDTRSQRPFEVKSNVNSTRSSRLDSYEGKSNEAYSNAGDKDWSPGEAVSLGTGSAAKNSPIARDISIRCEARVKHENNVGNGEWTLGKVISVGPYSASKKSLVVRDQPIRGHDRVKHEINREWIPGEGISLGPIRGHDRGQHEKSAGNCEQPIGEKTPYLQALL
jgi:hypothetical protein